MSIVATNVLLRHEPSGKFSSRQASIYPVPETAEQKMLIGGGLCSHPAELD